MKNLLVTATLLTSLIGFSQRSEHKGMHNLSPEQMATLQTKKLTLALDLDEDQQQEIFEFSEENAIARKKKMEARKASHEEDKSKKPSADERFKMQEQRLDLAIEHKAKMKEILSEEQFEKWERIQMKKGHHKGHKGQHKRGQSKPQK